MFVDDINLKNQYYALTIRSQTARRRIKEINCPPLEAGYRLIRAEDIPGSKQLFGSSIPALADDELHYIGEPVAIIVGPDILKLEELAGQIVIETEDLQNQPVFTIDDTTAEITAQIMLDFDASVKNTATPKEKQADMAVKLKPEEAAAAIDGASVDNGAADAPPEPDIVTGSYRTGIQEHWYSEPHGALAVLVDEGIKVHTATQWPEHVTQSVAAALAMPPEAVSLETAELGLHLDGKIWYPSLIAVHAALAAFITKKPVKLILTREEDFRFSPKRPETMIEFSTKLGPNGEPCETEIKIRASFGAGGFFEHEMLDNISKAAAGYYKLGHIKLSAEAVLANLPPACPFAGFGAALGAFALERHAAKIADALGIGGEEWRAAHYNEKKIPADEIIKLSENLITHSDYKRKRAVYELLRRRGKTAREKMLSMRGIGITTVLYTGKRPVLSNKIPPDYETPSNSPPLAASIVELEIDKVDFSAKIRGVWMSVCTGRLDDKQAMRRKLLQNIICALGWTAFEKLEYKDGQIDESAYFNYRIPPPSAIPRINIFLSERGSKEEYPEVISGLPYCVIPAAYLQALTQACDHHFESIPVFSRDIWELLQKQLLSGENEE
ncbi:MAG: molybdopterin-dependent oxidoreductase [Spirochaetaceae bacterium]|nr:molybdopterin-dependent oxidoreductase [Spirochaetaceae bacterium]